MKIHCFFEQSGTFKNEFKKLGYEAEDYDILNDFGETDNQIDLFSEIEKAYRRENSIFDKISPDDLIMAFLPCIRFEEQIRLGFRGEQYQSKNYTDEQKLEYDLKLHSELTKLYALVTKLAIVCLRKSLKLIIENPWSERHYLRQFWALKPKIIDKNRRLKGDYYTKPTQYWFIGCEPKDNFVIEPIEITQYKKIVHVRNTVERSLISKNYARRFIKEFIL